MFVEAAEGLVAAASIYKERQTILAAFHRFGVYLIRGNTNVAVFGPGGTGKTTLGLFVNGNLESGFAGDGYTETIVNTSLRLNGNIPGKIMVPPGQDRRRPGNWDQLYSQITYGNVSRVINVVSWGHHSTMLERSRLDHYASSALNFSKAYVEDGRVREINSLQQIVPHLKAAPGRLRLLTVVLKQDLWWDHRGDVRYFYEEGEYDRLIQDIKEYKGLANFQHDIISAALVQQNLRTGDGVDIVKTSAGYDDVIRLSNLSVLANGLRELVQ